MHELGLVFQVIDRVTEVAAENHVTKIERLVLEIGAASYVVPMFIEEVYADACKGTVLEGSRLEIETIPAIGLCRDCRRQFDLMQFEGRCPRCGKQEFDVLSGKEFLIKEIVVPDAPEP